MKSKFHDNNAYRDLLDKPHLFLVNGRWRYIAASDLAVNEYQLNRKAFLFCQEKAMLSESDGAK